MLVPTYSCSDMSSSRKCFECDSVKEFVADIESHWKSNHYHQSSLDERSSNWTIFKTFKEFNDIVLGRKRSDIIENFINDRIREPAALKSLLNYEQGYSNIFRDDFDISGFYVDVGRFLSGEPECFMNSCKSVNELVDIYVSGSIHCHTSAQAYMDDVLLLARLVYLLKLKGCNSRIFYCIDSTYGSAKIKIKDYRDNLDLRALVVVMMPDFFRRYGFKLFELDPDLDTGGYGRNDRNYFAHVIDNFSKNVCNLDFLRHDTLNLSDELINEVAKKRSVKEIVKAINEY